jgi:hypothetical protein
MEYVEFVKNVLLAFLPLRFREFVVGYGVHILYCLIHHIKQENKPCQDMLQLEINMTAIDKDFPTRIQNTNFDDVQM